MPGFPKKTPLNKDFMQFHIKFDPAKGVRLKKKQTKNKNWKSMSSDPKTRVMRSTAKYDPIHLFFCSRMCTPVYMGVPPPPPPRNFAKGSKW